MLALPIAAALSAVVRHVAIPVPLTPLVGRMSELTELTAAFGAHRLVTVTGPDGAGKTRWRWLRSNGGLLSTAVRS